MELNFFSSVIVLADDVDFRERAKIHDVFSLETRVRGLDLEGSQRLGIILSRFALFK